MAGELRKVGSHSVWKLTVSKNRLSLYGQPAFFGTELFLILNIL